jgi:formylmethanofuran dehydrogenase subunit E
MIRREIQPALALDANHRALRRCHGCGTYARPSAEIGGRLLCERCAEKARRESETALKIAEG